MSHSLRASLNMAVPLVGSKAPHFCRFCTEKINATVFPPSCGENIGWGGCVGRLQSLFNKLGAQILETLHLQILLTALYKSSTGWGSVQLRARKLHPYFHVGYWSQSKMHQVAWVCLPQVGCMGPKKLGTNFAPKTAKQRWECPILTNI